MTGGIRSVAAVGEATARLGQQLVMTGLRDAKGKPATSKMIAERFEIDYGGPALVQATSSGSLVDPERNSRLASFKQRVRLWVGRSIVEIDITLSDLDAAWLRTGCCCRSVVDLRGMPLGVARPEFDDAPRCFLFRRRSRKRSAPKLRSFLTSQLALNGQPFSSRGYHTIACRAPACWIRF